MFLLSFIHTILRFQNVFPRSTLTLLISTDCRETNVARAKTRFSGRESVTEVTMWFTYQTAWSGACEERTDLAVVALVVLPAGRVGAARERQRLRADLPTRILQMCELYNNLKLQLRISHGSKRFVSSRIRLMNELCSISARTPPPQTQHAARALTPFA